MSNDLTSAEPQASALQVWEGIKRTLLAGKLTPEFQVSALAGLVLPLAFPDAETHRPLLSWVLNKEDEILREQRERTELNNFMQRRSCGLWRIAGDHFYIYHWGSKKPGYWSVEVGPASRLATESPESWLKEQGLFQVRFPTLRAAAARMKDALEMDPYPRRL